MYDYLIVGAGLYGSYAAFLLTQRGKKCLVIDKRNHIGGNVYNHRKDDIDIHVYGPHIFHTSDDNLWNFLNKYIKFNNFINTPLAIYKNEIYNLPFNMNTFSKMWNITTPKQAQDIISKQKQEINKEPCNLEEQAISLVGKDIYEKLIKGYTQKQWGKDCKELDKNIIKRLPVRYTYNNNYFNDKYQGIPINGYNELIEIFLSNSDIKLNTKFDCTNKSELEKLAKHIIYTGPLDELFNYKLGKLEYRSLKFETISLQQNNYQGNAVINYTEYDIPYTRIIEHKHFNHLQKGYNKNITYITKEYPVSFEEGLERFYPINNDKNNELHNKYLDLVKQNKKYIIGGRLAEYKYYDMDKILIKCENDINNLFVKKQRKINIKTNSNRISNEEILNYLRQTQDVNTLEYPVCIPTVHNREKSVLKLLDNFGNTKIYLFIIPSEVNLYSYINKQNIIKVILPEEYVGSIQKARKYIQEYMNQQNVDFYHCIDDDVVGFMLINKKIDCSVSQGLKVLELFSKTIEFSSLSYCFNDISCKFWNGEKYGEVLTAVQYLFNNKKLKQLNLRFTGSLNLNEDLEFTMNSLLYTDLPTKVLRWGLIKQAYAAGGKNSIASLNNLHLLYQTNNYLKFGNYLKFHKDIRGFRTNINYSKIKKDKKNNNIKIEYDENLYNICINKDYEGLIKYVNK